jgi:hypothetical protein
MSDDVLAAGSAAPNSTASAGAAAPVVNPVENTAGNAASSAATTANAPAAPADDFDENLIPEGSRDNFRKYRESQKAKLAAEVEKTRSEFEKKLNDETRRRMEYEARTAEYEAKQKASQGQPEDPGSEPDYKSFATIEEYRDALKAWQKKAATFEYAAQQKQQEEQRKAHEEQAKVAAKGNAARQKYPDFNQVIAPILPVANRIPALVQFINEFDTGTDVLYHLGKNPAVLEGLSRMQPFAAGQELLRIQAALSAPAPKAVTQAPEPMKTVDTGNDSSVKGILELVRKEDVSDYVARENRKLMRRSKGPE